MEINQLAESMMNVEEIRYYCLSLGIIRNSCEIVKAKYTKK